MSKSWGNQGAACDTDVDITVSGSGSAVYGSSNVAPSGGSGPYVPSNAISVSNIQAFGDWISVFDPGTAGAATGAMAMVGSPSVTGNASGVLHHLLLLRRRTLLRHLR